MAISFLFDISIIAAKIHVGITYFFICMGALTGIMAFMNQYKLLQKNYHTLWIVVKINHVFTLITKKKKTRHYNKHISHPKKEHDGQSESSE